MGISLNESIASEPSLSRWDNLIWDGKQVIYLVDTKSYEVGRKQAKIGLCKVKKCPTLRGKLCSSIKLNT